MLLEGRSQSSFLTVSCQGWGLAQFLLLNKDFVVIVVKDFVVVVVIVIVVVVVYSPRALT